MGNKVVKLDEEFLETIYGGNMYSTLPMKYVTCPNCGCDRAWFNETWDGKTVYTCVKCEHEWSVD